MSSIKNEAKKTFTTFLETFKSDRSKEMDLKKEQNDNTDTVYAKTNLDQETRTATRRNAENMRNNEPKGRSMSTISQPNKPKRAIYVNKSTTVKVMEPKDKDDSYYIIEELRNKQTVMVKLNSVDAEIRKQIMDHILGACYYASFKVEQVDPQMVLIDPSFQ